MLDYVAIIALMIISCLFFCIGLWLAISDEPMVINEHTIFNQLITMIANKIVGCLYIIGSMITLAIIWS